MTIKKFLKYWFYSGSLTFAILSREKSEKLAQVDINVLGEKRKIYMRTGTSDVHLFYEILFRKKKSEYFSEFLPSGEKIHTILDIGANIGVASVYFKQIYPHARLFCFEPMFQNFDMLKKNVFGYSDVDIHQVVLSSEDATIEMIASPSSDNKGGWSIFQRGATDEEERVLVEGYHAGRYLDKLGVSSPDLIKIDTEGAEKKILMSLHDYQLENVKYIVGELHGERDFELLDWLEQKGFDIEMKKSFNKSLFIFKAIRKELLG